MGRRLGQLGFLTLLLAGLGCQTSKTSVMQPKPTPPDPLLISKKPVEGRSRGGDPLLTYEPSAPREPVASRDQSRNKPISLGYRPSDESGVNIGRPTTTP
jgi:hypothetical protein